MSYVENFTAALVQRFLDPNREFTPLPQPPTWYYNEDEDRDDGGDDKH